MAQSNQPSAFNYAVANREIDVQTFTSSGRWVKPPNATFVIVDIWSGAGGGASGRRGATSTLRKGGGGGGGGVRQRVQFLASDLTSIVAVTIGAGGAGGTAMTADSFNELQELLAVILPLVLL